MFERFSREARDAVVKAQEEARAMGSRNIDTRHVLVALTDGGGPAAEALHATGVDTATLARHVRDDVRATGLDRDALATLGIDLDAVSEHADRTFGSGALGRTRRRNGHIPFTTDAKKALDLALREAIRLSERRIDSRHLLLGMLRAQCPARDVLADQHIDLEALRGHLEQPTSPPS